jgi:hypothetical protein
MVQQRAGTFPWRMKKEETQVSTKEELIAEMYKRQVDGRVAGKAPEHMIDTQPATKLTKAAKKAKDAKTKETEVAKANFVMQLNRSDVIFTGNWLINFDY